MKKLITVPNELFRDCTSFRSALQSTPEMNGEKWKKVGGDPTQINLQGYKSSLGSGGRNIVREGNTFLS